MHYEVKFDRLSCQVDKFLQDAMHPEAFALGEAVLNPRVAARMVKELHGQRDESVNPFSELTDREMEVLRQIAAGKSNHEIAAVLVISEKTVKSHITNLLAKLHLADRTQAAVFAWQEGIVRRGQA